MNWPEQKVVVRLTTKRATNIKQAFKSAIDGDAIAQAWAETHPAGGSVSPQTARDWTLAHAVVNQKPLQYALSRIYADGYTLGVKVAETRLTGLKKGVTAGIVDWSTWKPGLPSAAALVKPRGGLKQLLDSRKITVANEITRTKLDRIGTALSRSLSKGDTTKETAKAINAIIADPQHALVIAQTELSRAMSVASRDSYEEANIEQVEWLVAEGCEDCQENADASPIGIDETFPSGDSEPPAHPNCMCALAPYYDFNAPETPNVDTPDFADEAQSLAEDMIAESLPEEISAPEPSDVTFDEMLQIGKDVPEIGMSNEDLWLNAIQNRMGFNALPTLVNEANLKTLTDKGWTPVYRGISGRSKRDPEFAAKVINEFKTGEHYAGNGIFGSGTYTSTWISTAKNYADQINSNVMHMAVSPTAKIIDHEKIVKTLKKELEIIAKKEGKVDMAALWRDPITYEKYKVFADTGRYAASKGYDVIRVTEGTGHKEEHYYVILNRAKVAVVK
jgi:hypothetical protein